MVTAMRALRGVVWRWAASAVDTRLSRYVLVAIVFLALCAFYRAAADREGLVNADSVSFVVEAQDLLRGNWNLHGWTIVNSAWWPVQPVVYAGTLLARGPVAATPYVAGLAWATMVACGVWAAARPLRGIDGLIAGAVAFLFVGLPAVDTAVSAVPYITGSPFEALTTAGGLLSLALFWKAGSTGPGDGAPGRLRTGLFAAAAVVIAGSIVTSDALALATVIVPVLVLAVLAVFRDRWDKRILAGAAFGIVAFMLSRFLLWLLHTTGGETVLQPVNWVTFAPFDQFFSQNLRLALQGLVGFFGAYWFGRPVLDLATLYVLVHLAALLFVLWAVGRSVAAAWRGRKQDWLLGVLALGFVSNLGAYVASILPAGLETSRYLLALLPYGGAVAGRAFGEMYRDAGRWGKVVLCGVVTVFTVASVSSFSVWLRYAPYVSPRTQLIKWLVDHDLRYGYAQYSDAAVLTVESEGRLLVRPLGTWAVDRVGPIPYSASQWYSEPMRFVVFDDQKGTGVSVPAAERTFGGGYTLTQVGPYQVAVWPQPFHVPAR